MNEKNLDIFKDINLSLEQEIGKEDSIKTQLITPTDEEDARELVKQCADLAESSNYGRTFEKINKCLDSLNYNYVYTDVVVDEVVESLFPILHGKLEEGSETISEEQLSQFKENFERATLHGNLDTATIKKVAIRFIKMSKFIHGNRKNI